MIRATRWTPDTCGCVLEYEWDDATPDDKRVHSFTKTVRACAAHTVLADDPAHLAGVLAENQKKNQVVAVLLETNPHLLVDQGDGAMTLRPGIRIDHSFDDQRALAVKVFGAPIDVSGTVAAIELKLGPDAAKIT